MLMTYNVIRYVRGMGLIASDSEEARTYRHKKDTAGGDEDDYHYYVSEEAGSVSYILGGKENEILNAYEYDALKKDENLSLEKAEIMANEEYENIRKAEKLGYGEDAAAKILDIIRTRENSNYTVVVIDHEAITKQLEIIRAGKASTTISK